MIGNWTIVRPPALLFRSVNRIFRSLNAFRVRVFPQSLGSYNRSHRLHCQIDVSSSTTYSLLIAFHYHSPQDSPTVYPPLVSISLNIIFLNILKYRSISFWQHPPFLHPLSNETTFLPILNNPSYGKSLFSMLWATSFTPNQDFGDFEWTPSRHFVAFGRPLTRQITILVLLDDHSHPKSLFWCFCISPLAPNRTPILDTFH